MSKIITITGPSGSGKDSLVDALLYVVGEKSVDDLGLFVKSYAKELDKLSIKNETNKPILKELISHTTRKPRNGEINGKDYYFVDKTTLDNTEMVEKTCYAGNYYGLSATEIRNFNAHVGIVIVDINGVEMVRNFNGKENTVSVFINVKYSDIENRMKARGDRKSVV